MSDHFSNKSLKIEEEGKVSGYLPPEILIEIVLRLPIKSIITWTSVSKSWNSLIKSPDFISTHLNHNQTHLLLLGELVEPICGEKEVYSLHRDNESFDEYTRFEFPVPGLGRYGVFGVVGTSNGLVCLADEFQDSCNFYVWNPCVRKYLTLPPPNVTSKSFAGGMFDVSNGFGFDSKTNDYKVVRVVTLIEDWGESPPKVDVFSLATGKWKMVTALPPTCAVREPGSQTFLNGALHWPVLRSTTTEDEFHNFVLAFDLFDEEFREVMLPEDLLIDDNSFHLSVSVRGESLAAFHTTNLCRCLHVWVMKEYGVMESWTKVLTVDTQGPEIEVPRIFDFLSDEDDVLDAIGFRKSVEVVIQNGVGKLVSIDSESKTMKDIKIPGPGHGYSFVDPYVESLVLLDKSEDAVSY